MLLGIDVSNWQAEVNWPAMRKDGARFAWAKATEGTKFVDKWFKRNRSEAKKAGIVFGAYHFARPRNDPKAEARHFHKVIGNTDGELPPVLDLESSDGKNRSHISRWADDFIREFTRIHGREPVFYTYPSFARQYLSGRPKGISALWIAHYTTAATPDTANLGAWDFWQFSSSYPIAGRKIDANRFKGSLTDLMQFVNEDGIGLGDDVYGYEVLPHNEGGFGPVFKGPWRRKLYRSTAKAIYKARGWDVTDVNIGGDAPYGLWHWARDKHGFPRWLFAFEDDRDVSQEAFEERHPEIPIRPFKGLRYSKYNRARYRV